MSTPDLKLDELARRLADDQARVQEAIRSQLDAAAPPAYAEMFRQLIEAFSRDPEHLRTLQQRYFDEQWALWRSLTAAEETPAENTTAAEDPRFRAAEWRELPWFDYLRRSYEATARWTRDLLDSLPDDIPDRRKLLFYGRQFIDAVAPSNFAYTNPEVIRRALKTGGRSLAQGLANLAADADKKRVSMTDEAAFAPGRNLALMPGAVVFQNELVQLIQYRPSTGKVRQRPLLIVPPFINKFYILDLQPANSFVRHAVEQGLTVFVISWRDIDDSLASLTWDDYIVRGVHAAIDAIRTIQPRRRLNVLGFCVGGTLLATALAVMPPRERRAVASLTLLAAMLDFSDTGDISAYVDEAYVRKCEHALGSGGVFSGRLLGQAFASLRPNDLVWRYVVGNYLKGETPPAFDLLYWNSDSANLPGPLYAYYLRHMYLENALRQSGRLTMCGTPVDLAAIDLPTYVLAAKEDHIVPWRTAYASAALLGADVTFVRAASGHIAGVVSPPGQKRRSYRSGPMQSDADAWETQSTESPGSWWEHWIAWIARHAGPEVAAPKRLGSRTLPPLEAAPGTYVLQRADEPNRVRPR